jgi:hypothetical protein
LGFIEDRYDPAIGLVRETPTWDKYWVWSDNFLAQLVLKHENPELAQQLAEKVLSYPDSKKNPWFTLDPDYRQYTSFLGTTEINVDPTNNVWISDYSVGTTELSCSDYADVAFLKAIHLFFEGKAEQSRACYDSGKAKWDGTGFKDSGGITGDYQVYKSALGMLAERVTGFSPIGIPGDYFDRFLGPTGGIRTDIKDGEVDGLENIETTAAVYMALFGIPE